MKIQASRNVWEFCEGGFVLCVGRGGRFNGSSPRSPTLNLVTEDPAEVTTPQTSLPKTTGYDFIAKL